MAVNIIRSPQTISWSRNPIVFELEGTNYYKSTGTDVMSTLTFSSPFAVSDKLTIAWGDEIREYFVVPGLNFNNPLAIGWQSGMTTEEFVTQFAADLRGDQVLYERFVIKSSANKLYIIPRERNTYYNITVTDYPSAKVHVNIQTVSFSDKKNPNYAILIELLVSMDGENYETFTQSIIEPEDNSRATWDIQEYLTSYLKTKAFTGKNLSDDNISIDNKSRVYYYLRMAEMYGTPQVMEKARESPRYSAILGGVPLPLIDKMVLPSIFTDGSIQLWMTNINDRKLFKNQLDYLNIINWGADKSNISIRGRAYGFDDSLRTFNIGSVPTWKYLDKLIIPIQLNNLGSLGIDHISSIEVWLESAGARVTPSYSLAVNNNYYPFGQTLLFRNSLGNFETIYTYGKKEQGYEIKKEMDAFEPILEPVVMDAIHKEFDIEIRDEIRINSGYHSKSEIERFRDFFLSDEKYVLKDNIWIPVVLDSSSIKEYEDGNYLYGITFTLQHANEQTLWA